MKPRDSVQRENFSTYKFALYLVAGLVLSEFFLGWYLVSQDYGRVSYIRILLTMLCWLVFGFKATSPDTSAQCGFWFL